MRISRVLFAALMMALLAVAAQAGSKQWVHLRVESHEEGKGPEKVKVNVPVSLMETILPIVEEEGIKDGKIRIKDKDMDVQKLRKIWAALKEEGDMEYVSVETEDTNFRVFKQGNFLYVRSNDQSKDQVDIQVPTQVVDAMLSGKDDELNLLAALEALKDSGVKDIITVKSDDATVRVWIDDSPEAK